MPKDSIKKKDKLGILAENMNSQFGLVMEGFSVLTTEVRGLKGKVDSLEGKVDSLEGKVDSLEGKVDSLEGKVDGLTNQIKEVDERLSTFQNETNSKFETVFNYLSAIEPQSGKINNLEKRVIIVEKQLTKNK